MDRKSKGYWSFDKVKEEALKYTRRNNFNKLNGWLNDVSTHMNIS